MALGAFGVYISLFLALYFEVFLMLSFFEKRPAARTKSRPTRYPSVAMLVPCYNEERTIGATIESLLALDYPQDKLSIMVIDDGSKDGTAAIAKGYAARYLQVQYHYKENGGKYTALNFGIQNSTAEIIGCLDADSFVARDALIEVVKKFEDDKTVMALTPAMQVYKPASWLEVMQAVEYTFGIFYKKMFDNLSAISVLPGPFSLYKRAVFEKAGLFRHAHDTEEMEIAFRMHAHGLKIANAHTAYVYTTVPSTIRALVRQRTRWSQGFLQNSQDYKYMYFNRKYGNFGLLILPIGLSAFLGGLYMAGYTLYQAGMYAVTRAYDLLSTGVPPTLPTSLMHGQVDWFYLNTDMMMFVVAAVLSMTLAAIILGSRIAGNRLTVKSYVSYFVFFGLLAPLWLVRAIWGALLARESAWR